MFRLFPHVLAPFGNFTAGSRFHGFVGIVGPVGEMMMMMMVMMKEKTKEILKSVWCSNSLCACVNICVRVCVNESEKHADSYFFLSFFLFGVECLQLCAPAEQTVNGHLQLRASVRICGG